MEKSKHLALQRDVQEALNEASIYEIGSYGWVSENDPGSILSSDIGKKDPQ